MKTAILMGAAASLMATAAFAGHHEEGEKKMKEAPELTGVYASDDWVMTLMPEGMGVGVVKETGMAFAIIKHGSKDGMFWMKDVVSPPNADDESRKCAKENKGKYSYALDEGTLSFTLVEDPCANRAEAMNGLSATKVEMSAPAEE